MSKTDIEWCHYSFSPWSGCTKIKPECAKCYAAVLDNRFNAGSNWGHKGTRKRQSEDYWNPWPRGF